MRFAAGNAQNIGARPQQQDAFGFSDPSDRAFVTHGGFLGVVADGVGGLTHGSEASQSAVRAFLQAYRLKSPAEPIREALARSLRAANTAVLRVASAPSAEGAGTTLIAAVLHGQSLYWISAGDSRIYLLHDSRLTRVTSDHVYARELDEQAAQGLISRDEALNHSERGSLTSYLGQPEPKEVDRNTRPLGLEPDDCVILCSDGFYRALDELEIVGGFRGDLQRGCDDLVGQVLAKQRKRQDNLTVIALKCGSRSGKWQSQAQGNTRSRMPLFALAALFLAVLSAGAGYWYEKNSATSGQTQPSTPAPASSSVPNQENSAAGNETNTKPPENPPPRDTKHQAAAMPAKPPRPRPPKPPKVPNSTASKTNEAESSQSGSSPSGSSQKAPGQVQDKMSAPDQPTPADGAIPPVIPPPDQPAPAGATAPPVVPPPAVETTPPSPPAGTAGQASPSNQAPGNNQEKEPLPAPAPDTKPDGPPNLVLGRTTRSALQPSRTYIFRALELSWALGTKDGEPSCHS